MATQKQTSSKPLAPGCLRRTINLARLGITKVQESSSSNGLVGQDRAVRSLQFSLEMACPGFNVYVAGPPGIGKMTAVSRYLEAAAKDRPTPSDWCYVYNFVDPYRPNAIELPPGKGRELEADMRQLIDFARRDIPGAFESEDYSSKREQLTHKMEERRDKKFQELAQKAASMDFAIQMAPFGIAVMPVKDGTALSEEEFNKLSKSRQAAYERNQRKVDVLIEDGLKQFRALERETHDAVTSLDEQVALYVVGDLVDDLLEKYRELPAVIDYLKGVQDAILADIGSFRAPNKPEGQRFPATDVLISEAEDIQFRQFKVNVFVDNAKQIGAPVVVELNPIYTNLFGRLERESRLGALHADFTGIKHGSLHRANGGYLVLPVEGVLQNVMSWEGLKRALRSAEIEIEDLSERFGYVSTKGLRPQSIPLNVKVVLIGQRYIQQLLVEHDQEFMELFKVRADFDTQMEATPEAIRDFLGFLRQYCGRERLAPIADSGYSAILEHALRLAEDQERLSTHFGKIGDLVRESNYWARKAGSKTVERSHVEEALAQSVYRSRLVEDRIQEMLLRGTILVDTQGSKVGQLNGLSVLAVGDYSFGKPSRITASVGPGADGVVDIEREVEMGGPIHSKGVLILGGYLQAKYAVSAPLALSGRVVFEQSYDGVEGDSASCGELLALISAISGVPLSQSIAITGSVNQHGEIQAIGGVNEKIEGFFEICKARGLTGNQGVAIPESNQQNLMLRQDVVDAAREGRFNVWPISTVDQALELLTGMPSGERNAKGEFPEGTLNWLVQERLKAFASIAERMALSGPDRANRGDRMKTRRQRVRDV